MTVEETYKKLVGEEGYLKVKQVPDLWELNESSRELFFSALTNAYWRGANAGIDECRAILSKKGSVTSDNKPTN
jgi:hypothetical protein